MRHVHLPPTPSLLCSSAPCPLLPPHKPQRTETFLHPICWAWQRALAFERLRETEVPLLRDNPKEETATLPPGRRASSRVEPASQQEPVTPNTQCRGPDLWLPRLTRRGLPGFRQRDHTHGDG